ncbi:MAG: hypothetical protein A3K10_18095 [Bacteroidetes bacterium RIFCSPLOWO2_12_FULL_31_6]|nr:MAG: hypothetical protein A3K10_18095 [Bacteroidetes bacterium RIFCSPLOWO2_12_FULL_31_6]
MIAILIYTTIESVNEKWVIEKGKFIYVGILKTKELLFNQVAGFKIREHYIDIIIKDSKKVFKISKYIGERDELIEWLSNKFTDFSNEETINDLKSVLTEEKRFLENPKFGLSSEERLRTLEKVKKVALILKFTPLFVIVLWLLLISPAFIKFIVVLCAIWPLLCFAIHIISDGFIALNGARNSSRPSVDYGFFPAAFLCLVGLYSHVYSYQNFWTPFALSLSFLAFTLFFIEGFLSDFKKWEDEYSTIFIIIFFSIMYSHGLITSINSEFDNSQPVEYNAKILDKYYSKGKGVNYKFKITPWGPQTNASNVSVSSNMYKKKVVGDSTRILFFNGVFGIPHYVIAE